MAPSWPYPRGSAAVRGNREAAGRVEQRSWCDASKDHEGWPALGRRVFVTLPGIDDIVQYGQERTVVLGLVPDDVGRGSVVVSVHVVVHRVDRQVARPGVEGVPDERELALARVGRGVDQVEARERSRSG